MREHYGVPDTATLAEGSALPYLHGFWNEDHNIPGSPQLVEGDPEQFARDRRAAAARSRRRLDVYAQTRWMLIEEWDRWEFQPEIWE